MSLKSRLRKFMRLLGPGLITGASDDDPSGIATYSQAGATFGLATLWTALLTTPLMAATQEMCARIGVVTKHGLMGIIRRHYPKYVAYLMLLISTPAIVFNIGADISAMGAVSHMMIPQVPAAIFGAVLMLLMVLLLLKLPYRRIASMMKWLCLALLAYLVVPFLVIHDWPRVIMQAIVPTIALNKDFILILVAIFGTTISPYLFFWQAASEVEDVRHRHLIVNKRVVHNTGLDTDIGMFFSNLIMFFLILVTGSVLFGSGITQISTVSQAAAALKPLAGSASYLLFAIGVIGAGFIAIPVLAGSLAYVYEEIREHEASLDKKFRKAKGFYGVLIASLVVGLLINLAGISPINMLVLSAVLYGLTAPVLIALILHISNNKSIMGKYTNGRLSNALGVITFLVMAVTAVVFLYMQFL